MNPYTNKTNHPVTEGLGLFTVSTILILTIGAYVQMNSIITGLIVTEILLILLPVLCFIWLKKLEFTKALRLKKISFGIAVRSVMLGISAWGIAILLYRVCENIMGSSLLEYWDATLYPADMSELLIALLVTAVLPGLCEEILFRGVIQSLLEKKGIQKGLLYTSLLFAIFHFNPWGILPIFFLGLIIGLLAIRTNSIIPAIIAHTSVNATSVIVNYLTINEKSQIVVEVLLALIFVAILGEFFYKTKHEQYRPPILAGPTNPISRTFIRSLFGIISICLVLILVSGLVFLDRYRMTSDMLNPEVEKNDIVVVLSNRFVHTKIKSNTIVAYKKNGTTFLRKVKYVDNNYVSVVVKPDGTVEKLPYEDITGKVIYVIHLKKW